MAKNCGILLFWLSCCAVLLVVLNDLGFLVKNVKKLEVAEKSDQVLTALDRTLPPTLRVRQDGVLLEGPYTSLAELSGDPIGRFSWKGDRIYIRPFPDRARTFTLDLPYVLPAWSGLAASILVAASLVFVLGGGSQPGSFIQPGRKLPYLDGVRGCACMTVVLFHFTWAYCMRERFGAMQVKALLEPFPFGALKAGSFCVEVFFVLSGFVLALPYLRLEKTVAEAKLRTAVVRRPVRLVGMMLPVLVAAYLLGYGDPPPDFGTFLADLTTSPFARAKFYMTPLWTLWTELYGSLGLFIGLWIAYGMGVVRRRFWIYVWAAVLLHNTYFIGFVAGAALAEGAAAGVWPVRTPRAIWLVAVGTVAGLWLASYNNELQTGYHFTNAFLNCLGWVTPLRVWAAVLIVFGALNLGSLQKFLGARWIQFLGHISYALYLVHWLALYSVGVPLIMWLKSSGRFSTEVTWSIGWVVYFTTAVGVAWAATRWIDEPTIRMSRRFASRLLSSAPPEAPPAVRVEKEDPRQA